MVTKDENIVLRLMRAMKKLQRGESLAIVTLGGSITTGYAAKDPPTEGWAGLVQQWWEQKAHEVGGSILFHNAGLSGTDSVWATVRLKDQVMRYDPDVVFVEFAINDQWLDTQVRLRSYEGLLRSLLDSSERAVVLLFLNEKAHPERGQGKEQAELGRYYGLPMLRWADWVKPEEWDRYFNGNETIHPNTEGHESIARGIVAMLEEIWEKARQFTDGISPVADLVPPCYSDEFQFVRWIHSGNSEVLVNTGWVIGGDIHPEWFRCGGSMPAGWRTADSRAQFVVRVRGKSVGILYSESDQYRNALAWVEYPDGRQGKKVSLDCFVPYRKGYVGWAYRELVQGAMVQEYRVHVEVKKSRASDEGKWVNVAGIVVTGVSE
ncbi:MAG: SGNH/GDSL hydrolase family protein [Treponemataceae bacterium]|nr:SGNH/GDSL hydrolase family protein [Treponemataceae bacterium]